MSNHPTVSSATLVTLRHLGRALRRLALPSRLLPTAFEPVALWVPALGIRDGCVAIEGAGLEPMTLWIFRERAEHARVGFPIGREVRHACKLTVSHGRWSLASLDGNGRHVAPDQLDLELAAAVADVIGDFLSACEEVLAGLGAGRVERTFLIPTLPRIGLLRLAFGEAAEPTRPQRRAPVSTATRWYPRPA